MFAEELVAYTNQQIYSTQHPLLVYGTGPENSPLILRLFAPDGTIAEFEQIITNSDGSFSHKMLDWPSSSTKYPFGTYTIEAITNIGESQKMGFQPIKYQQNDDGSNTLVLERWNENTLINN